LNIDHAKILELAGMKENYKLYLVGNLPFSDDHHGMAALMSNENILFCQKSLTNLPAESCSQWLDQLAYKHGIFQNAVDTTMLLLFQKEVAEVSWCRFFVGKAVHVLHSN
jgi:hypothetical protein